MNKLVRINAGELTVDCDYLVSKGYKNSTNGCWAPSFRVPLDLVIQILSDPTFKFKRVEILLKNLYRVMGDVSIEEILQSEVQIVR